MSLRDVREVASHADPRTIMRYEQARISLDQHARYLVATYVAGLTGKGLAAMTVPPGR
jgi:integrase/recombinase XerD